MGPPGHHVAVLSAAAFSLLPPAFYLSIITCRTVKTTFSVYFRRVKCPNSLGWARPPTPVHVFLKCLTIKSNPSPFALPPQMSLQASAVLIQHNSQPETPRVQRAVTLSIVSNQVLYVMTVLSFLSIPPMPCTLSLIWFRILITSRLLVPDVQFTTVWSFIGIYSYKIRKPPTLV